jgi:predicted ATPase/DNA-binding XRE family transcriptional regulator
MDAVAPPTFATLLRRYRIAAGLTQEELAERANLSVRGVSDLERGLRKAPRSETVILLADALNLSSFDRAEMEASVSRRRGPSGQRAVLVLPAEPTSLIGREQEESRGIALIREERVRLLTLTGPGGVGKTRLALRLAHRLKDDFIGGAAFISLASIRDPSLAPVLVASGLGLRPTRDQTAEELLVTRLAGAERLLVLDNFEHLLEAARFVSRLLSSCPHVAIIVTSRAALHLQAEWDMEIHPLAMPPITPRALDTHRFPAVALFLERARAVSSDFQVTDDALPTIVQICHALDGLPLAIELAAAHVKVLSPEVILSRLEHRLALLTGGPRDVPDRQQTMRNTIAWSYNLLPPAEQALFRRLSVFSGGCTVEAAEAVCRNPDSLAVDTLDGLTSLVDKSLLIVHGDGEQERTPRFSMLETVREFAYDELVAESEAEAVRNEHARYYLSLAEKARADLSGPEQGARLLWLEGEHQNFRAALRTARDHDDVELGLRLVAALWPYWLARSHFEEAQKWLDRFLARAETPDIPIGVRARALYAGGSLVAVQGDNDRVVSLMEQALALARQAGDDATAAAALRLLALTNHARGRFRDGEALLNESLALYRRLDDRVGVCTVLTGMAGAARFQGDFERAVHLYQEALDLSRANGDIHATADILARLGNLETERGKPERSHGLYEDARALHRGLGDRFGMADILLRSAETAVVMGDPARALRLLEDCLPVFRSLGIDYAVAFVHLFQSEACLGVGDLTRAETLGGRALQYFRTIGDLRCAGDAVTVLADIARERQDLDQALVLYKAAIVTHTELNLRPSVAKCLQRMAVLAAGQGQPKRAACLHGAARSLRAAMGAAMAPAERELYERCLDGVCSQLGEPAFAASVAEGEAMTLRQAVHYAVGGDIEETP